jgi:hypothetical protein
MTDGALDQLHAGAIFRFAYWPNASVPRFGAGVYAIWDASGVFIYAGMSGRSIRDVTPPPQQRPLGLYTRLHSHASGRRSGDQFCVYVADRLVLPTLSTDDIQGIAAGRHSMDAFVRRFIHEQLGYRFLMMPNGASALAAERSLRTGAWEYGKPYLNPSRA